MKLAIPSAGTAVGRSLAAIATASGATLDETASLSLRQADGLLQLIEGDRVRHQLALPARPSAIARLLAQAIPAGALAGGWSFDATARQLTRQGDTHMLTEKEALLLQLLLQHFPEPCPRDTLLKDGWGIQSDIETHTLETHIYRLRHKLAELSPKPCDIATVDSAYLLTMEPAE